MKVFSHSCMKSQSSREVPRERKLYACHSSDIYKIIVSCDFILAAGLYGFSLGVQPLIITQRCRLQQSDITNSWLDPHHSDFFPQKSQCLRYFCASGCPITLLQLLPVSALDEVQLVFSLPLHISQEQLQLTFSNINTWIIHVNLKFNIF